MVLWYQEVIKMPHYYINEELQKERIERRKKRMPFYALSKVRNKVLLFLGIILIIFLLHYASTHTKEDDINIMNALESEFKGNFTILSSEKEKKGNITYLISDNNGIEFKAYKSGTTRVFDYQDKLAQKYILEYLEENHLSQNEKLFIEEQPHPISGSEFHHICIVMAIDHFDEIESITRTMNDLYHTVCQKIASHTKDSSASMYALLRFGDVDVQFLNIAHLPIEQLLTSVKTLYVNNMKANKIIDTTIADEDVQKYWHPEELIIYINNEPVIKTNSSMFGTTRTHQTVHYRMDKEDYYINLPKVLLQIPNVTNIDKSTTGLVFGFTYENNNYTFDGKLEKIKGSKLPYDISLTEFKELFHANIKTEFETESLFIEI